MDPMQSAIKGRRGGLLNEQEENAGHAPAPAKPGGSADMQGLVQSLAPEQKSQLLALLVKDQSGDSAESDTDPVAIQEGAMGPGEEMDLENNSSEQGQEGDGHESENQIMESMISSADKGRVDQGAKPRNLGERVKMSLASKLKDKKKG